MGTKILVEVTDDLDGSTGAETLRFSLDGRNYEIDLSERNATEFRQLVDRYATAGRRISRTGGAAVRRQPPPLPPGQAKKIREWAGQNGIDLSARGRIPADVVATYEEARNAGL